MTKSIFKIAMLLSIFSIVVSSCGKDEVEPEAETTGSFTMTYDGVTYTGAEQNSLILSFGTIAAAGTAGDGFLLTVIGVGDDGTTTNIVPNESSVMLDFGAVVGSEGFVAQSGTIKRTGKKIEVNAKGISTDLTEKSLSATIVVTKVL
jgi:hypothetical protein